MFYTEVVDDVVFKPHFGSTRISLDFLHTNKVPSCILIRDRFTNKVPSCILMWISCILIWDRFTNKRQSRTIKTISLPALAR